MTLNNVVLPAPLGPMRPVTRPGSAVRSTSCRAITPPKRTLTSSTDRSDNAVHLLGDLVAGDAGVVCGPSAEPVDRPADLAHDPVGAAGDSHRSQAGAQERDVLDADVLGNDVEARAQQHAAEKGAGDRQYPADGDHEEHDKALDVDEVDAADAAAEAPEEGAADARHRRRQREHPDLRAREIKSEGGAGGRAVFHGREQTPERPAPYGKHEGAHEYEDDGEQDRVRHLAVEGDA